MSEYASDIAKYTANVDAKAVDAIVKYCGIALQSRDASLVSSTDAEELARVRDGFYAADHVDLIDPQPGVIGTPWAGDVHAQGNPHLHTDPHKLLEVAQALAGRLQEVRPAQREAIAERLRNFERQWRASITHWERQAAPLRGRA